jgi:hypothetical protein
MTMIQLNWDEFYNVRPKFDYDHIILDTRTIDLDETVDFGAPVGSVLARDLMLLARPYLSATSGAPDFQLAMHFFGATRRVCALNSYFPLTKNLDKDEQKAFYRLAGEIIRQPNFKVCMIVPEGVRLQTAIQTTPVEGDVQVVRSAELTTNAEITFFVACHIAEMLFYRRDLLDRLLSTPFEIRLALNLKALIDDGGLAGGNYDPDKACIQMQLSRLFEGYNSKTPGVAPFLHEFGHLLDHFDVAEGEFAGSNGTLPGMRPDDGDLYNPEARDLFSKGKKLEWDRYISLVEHGYHEGDPLPVGHPYLFQSDTEFVAGYCEMFFRNPHYFAQQNPDLYQSFVLTFKQDPRKVWDEDFQFYIEQNERYYEDF